MKSSAIPTYDPQTLIVKYQDVEYRITEPPFFPYGDKCASRRARAENQFGNRFFISWEVRAETDWLYPVTIFTVEEGEFIYIFPAERNDRVSDEEHLAATEKWYRQRGKEMPSERWSRIPEEEKERRFKKLLEKLQKQYEETNGWEDFLNSADPYYNPPTLFSEASPPHQSEGSLH